MDPEELIALALVARVVAHGDDAYAAHYMELRHACFTQTGVDVAKLGEQLARLGHAV